MSQDYQRCYFNTNSGTIYFQDASFDILIHSLLLLCESTLFGTILDN